MAGVDLIDGVTLKRDVVSSIEFSNISQSYNHLWIIGTWANGTQSHWGSSMAVDFEFFASDSATTGWGTSGSWSMCAAGSVVIGSGRILNMHNSYQHPVNMTPRTAGVTTIGNSGFEMIIPNYSKSDTGDPCKGFHMQSVGHSPSDGLNHHKFGPLHRLCVYKPMGQGSTSGGGSTSDSVAITKLKFTAYAGSFMHGTSIMLYGME